MNTIPTLTRDEVRNVDRVAIEQLGLPGIALMENAGRGAAELLLSQNNVQRVVICAGGGNNGGDGFVIARHLMLAGCQVEVWLLSPVGKLAGDALINYRVASHLGIPIQECSAEEIGASFERSLEESDWIVDALCGTGLSSQVRPAFVSLIERINAAETPVFAVDIPSGLDCDSGCPLGVSIKAEITATFVAIKAGFTNADAHQWTGRVTVISIGVPWDLERTALQYE